MPYPFYEPFNQPQIPGGFVGQYMFSQMLGMAADQGYITDPFYTGGLDPFQAMRMHSYDARQQAILQSAALDQARLIEAQLAGGMRLAGQSVSPELQSAFSKLANLGAPQLANAAAMSPQVRQLLSLASGGVSDINVALGVEGITRSMVDPLSNNYGLNRDASKYMYQSLVQTLRQPAVLTSPIGMQLPLSLGGTYGLSDLEVMREMGRMAVRGELPTGRSIIDSAADDSLQAAITSGAITPQQLLMHGAEQSLFSRQLIAMGHASPEDFYNPEMSAVLDLRRQGIAGAKNVDAFLEDNFSQRQLLREHRRSVADLAAAQDQVAVDQIMGSTQDRLNSAASVGSRVGMRDIAGVAFRNALDNAMPWTGGRVKPSDFLPSTGAKSQKQVIADLETMSLQDFDTRALEFAAAAGSKLGAIDKEKAGDLSEALAAARSGDATRLGATSFGRMSRNEKISLLSAITGQDEHNVGYALTTHTASELRDYRTGRIDETDPYGLNQIKQIEAELTEALPGKEIVDKSLADRVAKVVQGRIKLLASAKEFLTNEELTRSIDEIGQISADLVDQLSLSATHQVSSHKISQDVMGLKAAASKIGLGRDQVMALGELAKQINASGGFEAAGAFGTRQELIRSMAIYKDMGLGALAELGDAYGMSSSQEAAIEDAKVLNDVRNSHDGSTMAAISILSKYAGAEVKKGSVVATLLADAKAGHFGERSRDFFKMSEAQRREAIVAGIENIEMRDLDIAMGNTYMLRKELDTNPDIRAAVQEHAKYSVIDILGSSYMTAAGSDLARKIGVTDKRQADEFAFNIGSSIAQELRTTSVTVAADESSTGILAVKTANKLLAEIKARAAQGSVADQKFLQKYSTDEARMIELQRKTYEAQAYSTEKSHKRAGEIAGRFNDRALEAGRTGVNAYESEALAGLFMMSGREGTWQAQAAKRIAELGEGPAGSGFTLAEILTSSVDIDVSGRSTAQLGQLEKQLGVINEVYERVINELDPSAEGAVQAYKEKQQSIQAIREKIEDARIANGGGRVNERTNKLFDAASGRPAGSAGELDIEENRRRALNTSTEVDAINASNAAAGQLGMGEKVARIASAVVDAINMNNVTININGKPVVQNGSGLASTAASRAGISAVPGS